MLRGQVLTILFAFYFLLNSAPLY